MNPACWVHFWVLLSDTGGGIDGIRRLDQRPYSLWWGASFENSAFVSGQRLR